MQRCIETHAPARWWLVGVAPRVQQCVGFRQKQALIGHLRPLSIKQAGAHITDMSEADIGPLRKRLNGFHCSKDEDFVTVT